MPRNDQCPYFYLYPDDFTSDRNVEAMTTEGVGAYFLLVCKSWFENPVASIPDDDRLLARWARLSPEQWSACKATVLAAFKMGKDGRWHQKRLRLEFEKLRRIKKYRSEAGRVGAFARHGKSIENRELHDNRTANAEQPQDFAKPNGCHTVLKCSSSSVVSSSEEKKKKDIAVDNDDLFTQLWIAATEWAGKTYSDRQKANTLRAWLSLPNAQDQESAFAAYLQQIRERPSNRLDAPWNFLEDHIWRIPQNGRMAPPPIKLSKGDEAQAEAAARFERSKR